MVELIGGTAGSMLRRAGRSPRIHLQLQTVWRGIPSLPTIRNLPRFGAAKVPTLPKSCRAAGLGRLPWLYYAFDRKHGGCFCMSRTPLQILRWLWTWSGSQSSAEQWRLCARRCAMEAVSRGPTHPSMLLEEVEACQRAYACRYRHCMSHRRILAGPWGGSPMHGEPAGLETGSAYSQRTPGRARSSLTLGWRSV